MLNSKEKQIVDKLPYQLSNGHQKYLLSALSPALRKIISAEQWKLGDRQYRDLNAEVLFQHLQLSEATALWLDLNKKAAILKEIVIPNYTRLKALYLGDNNISSIDSLSTLNAPTLQKLYLNHNKITCLRPFRRTCFSNLTELNLNGNYFEDQQWLVYCPLSKATKISLAYPSKKQKIWENIWFIKAQIRPQTTIVSRKGRIPSFNRKSFWMLVHQIGPTEPKNLFKTFEN